MADLSYFHGSKLDESLDTPSLLRIAKYGVTGIVGFSPDADENIFPLNTPVLVKSLTAAAALGEAGTLLKDVELVFGEGGSWCHVVRVAEGMDAAATEANIIGSLSARTGIYALLKAQALTGVKSSVVITAGNTGAWIEGGLLSVALSNQGAHLTAPPTVTATGGGSDPGKVLPTLEAVMGTGNDADKVASVKILTPGKKMTVASTITFAGGGSDPGKVLPACTGNIGDVANGLISALKVVIAKTGSRAYVSGPNTTDADAYRWRQTIGNDRIFPIDPLAIENVAGVPVVKPMAARFAGVRSRVVSSAEGVSGSVSNKPLRTLDGVARTVTYPDDSNYLNENSINTVINRGGEFRTWGSRLATQSGSWVFDSVRAVGDMINDSLRDLYFEWVDKRFTKANLKMMVEDGNNALKVFQLNGDILGGRVWLSDLNTPTLNAQGKVFLDVEFEPVVPMEQIHITTHRNIEYYTLLLEDVRNSIDNGPLTVA